jgi:predicted ATPase
MDNIQKMTIQNFGPISYAEIEIKKVMVLIGEQGSGKSAIIKLISSFMWLEKDFFRSSITEVKSKFDMYSQIDVKKLLSYYRIENYLNEKTFIKYEGTAYQFLFSNNEFTILKSEQNLFIYPQIIYIPAERNFVSYVDKFAFNDFIPKGLKDFSDTFTLATKNLDKPSQLPINNAEVYNDGFDNLRLKENGTYDIKLSEASSGFQSAVPIILVSEYLQEKMKNEDVKKLEQIPNIAPALEYLFKQIDDETVEKPDPSWDLALKYLQKILNTIQKGAFINIVEEPEQNLFPVSQMELVKRLVAICKKSEHNKLLISTHSPYVLATINNVMLAYKVGKNHPDEVSSKVSKNVWLHSQAVFAGIVKNGTVEEMIDTDLEMIQVEKLDAVSQIINEEFDYLLQYNEDK